MTTTPTHPPVPLARGDVSRRIRNILFAYPASTWDVAGAKTVLTALEGIVRERQDGWAQR